MILKTVAKEYNDLLNSLDRMSLLGVMSDPETCRLCGEYDETRNDQVGERAIRAIKNVLKSLE
jgi:hypothetical protein